MNLHNYYSQAQVQTLLGMPHRQQVKRWRRAHKIRYITICGKPFYFYQDVDQYLMQLVDQGALDRYATIKRLVKTMRHDLDLRVWQPRCLALENWPYIHETLYLATRLRTGLPLVRTKQV